MGNTSRLKNSSLYKRYQSDSQNCGPAYSDYGSCPLPPRGEGIKRMKNSRVDEASLRGAVVNALAVKNWSSRDIHGFESIRGRWAANRPRRSVCLRLWGRHSTQVIFTSDEKRHKGDLTEGANRRGVGAIPNCPRRAILNN